MTEPSVEHGGGCLRGAPLTYWAGRHSGEQLPWPHPAEELPRYLALPPDAGPIS